MPKPLLYIRKEHLAWRSQNIIDELGGLEGLLDFYNTHHSFLSIPEAGRFTNEQLCAYCNYLLTYGVEDLGKKIEEKKVVQTMVGSLVVYEDEIIPDMDKSLAIYENEKSFLSERVNNVLQKMELKYNFSVSNANKTEYLRDLFFKKFDFLTIQDSLEENLERIKYLVATYDYPEKHLLYILNAKSFES